MSNSYFNLLRNSWNYSGNKKGQYVLVYVLLALASGTLSLSPILYGWFIDKLQRLPDQVIQTTIVFASLQLVLNVITRLIHGPARILETNLAFRISRNFLDRHFGILFSLPISWHRDRHSGDTINRLQRAYVAIRSFVENGYSYMETIIKFLTSLVAMFYFSLWFGVIGFLLGVLAVVAIIQYDKRYIKSVKDVNETYHNISAGMADTLYNINSVLTLRLEDSVHQQLFEKFNKMNSQYRSSNFINEWKWFTANLVVSIIFCVIVIGFVVQNYGSTRTFPLGELTALVGFITQFTGTFYRVAAEYSLTIQYDAEIQACKSITDSYNQFKKPINPNAIRSNWKAITITDLSFSYKRKPYDEANSKKQTPHKPAGIFDVSIELGTGQRIAIMGASGNGKSTFLSLMRGMYDPDIGFRLKVDGEPVQDWSMLTNSVTLIPQEPEIFNNSMLFNITLGLPYDEADIENACKIAHLSHIVQELPNGWNEPITEKGANLSGGQRQRLGLARGILAAHSSSIIILDEPTSSVDPATELIIFHNLTSSFREKTIICAFHNIDLLPLFNRAYYFKDGRIVNQYGI